MKPQNGKGGNKNSKRNSSAAVSWIGPGPGFRMPNLTPSQLVKLINLDHSYALPSAPLEKKTHCFPPRLLFQNEEEIALLNEPKSKLENLLTRKSSKRAQKVKIVEEEDIDVCTPDDDPKIPYDHGKARQLMKECEKNVNFARIHDVSENWEEDVNKIGWTKSQRRLFKKMVQIFHDEHLKRLAYSENASEPLYRRLSIDKTTQAVRTLLTQFAWETKLIQWLHGVLMDNLSLEYLGYYLDILQTLKSKVPTLVEKMITASASGGKCNRATNVEALNLLLKRPWDPYATAIHTSKLKKPTVSAVFVVVPPGPPNGNVICHQRQKSWLSLLAGLGKVVTVSLPSTANKLNVNLYAEMMLVCSKQKLVEVFETSPDKPIYLVGWGSGAIVAATLSLTENVTGVICLGFPLHGTYGTRADVDDCLNDLKHPTLFVIGDRANNSSITDMEIFRKGLSCINGLSVICQADTYLRVTNYHQKRLFVTQSYVDKCIIDEIAWFLINVPILEDELKVQAQQAQEQVLVLDCPKMIPSNSSSNKRKAYYRPSNSNKDINSPNYITASKLLQQTGAGSKKKQSITPSSTPGIIKPPIISSGKTPIMTSTVPLQLPSPQISMPSSLHGLDPAASNHGPVPGQKSASKTAPKQSSVEARLRAITSMGIGTDYPLPSKIPKVANSKDPFTISVATTSAALQSSMPSPSKPSPVPMHKSWLSVTPVTSCIPSPIVSSVAAVSGITTAAVPTTAPPPYTSQLPITPILPMQTKEDSQILRRIITSVASTLSQPTSTVVSTPIVGLPKDTTATLSPHPIQVLTPNVEALKRYAYDSIMKTLPIPPPPPYRSSDLVRPHTSQPQQIRVITPTSLAMSQQQLKTTESLRKALVSFPQQSQFTGHPQIIRVSMSMPSSGIPPGSIITTTSAFNPTVPPTPRERPLPTRCTDESLSMDCSEDLQPRKGHIINPELFLQLKSTLSVSKDKRPPPPSPIPIMRVHDNSRNAVSLTRPPVSFSNPNAISTAPSPINVTYTPKYTVFASKDKRIIKSDTSSLKKLALSKFTDNTSTQFLLKSEALSRKSEPVTEHSKLVSVSLASFQRSPTAVTNIKLSPSSAAAAIDKAIKKGFEPFSHPTKPVVLLEKVDAIKTVPMEETGDSGSKNKADLKLNSQGEVDDMASKVTIIEITPNIPPNESSLTTQTTQEAQTTAVSSGAPLKAHFDDEGTEHIKDVTVVGGDCLKIEVKKSGSVSGCSSKEEHFEQVSRKHTQKTTRLQEDSNKSDLDCSGKNILNVSLTSSEGSATTLDTSSSSSKDSGASFDASEENHGGNRIKSNNEQKSADAETAVASNSKPTMRTYEARRKPGLTGKIEGKKQEIRKGRSQDPKDEVKSISKDAPKCASKDKETSKPATKDTHKSVIKDNLKASTKDKPKATEDIARPVQEGNLKGARTSDEGDAPTKTSTDSHTSSTKEESISMRKTRAQSLDEKRKSVVESSVDSDKGTDTSDNGSIPTSATNKRGRAYKITQKNNTSSETIDLSSDEEPAARVTRSRSRYSSTPVPLGSGDRSPSAQRIDEDVTTEEDEPEGHELRSEDDESANPGEDTESQRKKHLKPIHPVTPASLSATRTRKITIPKFYAFGM
ncbi:unnamed protein product [Allacma fusca]|uniref:KAT8 regulatory NSL complex subunit 3 n=1 Tax=Allacma fusca TaxID=39272 RepID=A0A8J2PF15_9HEXA|nr:unnamed protein product [Allacma fusca]